MKKKIFSIVAVLLLIFTSSINAEEILNLSVNAEGDCLERVDITVAQADATGDFTQEELEWISQAALAIYCYGYTLEDVLNAQQE